MKTEDYLFIYSILVGDLSKVATRDYAQDILSERVVEAVYEGVQAAADEDYNDDDVRLAFGRVILDCMQESGMLD